MPASSRHSLASATNGPSIGFPWGETSGKGQGWKYQPGGWRSTSAGRSNEVLRGGARSRATGMNNSTISRRQGLTLSSILHAGRRSNTHLPFCNEQSLAWKPIMCNNQHDRGLAVYRISDDSWRLLNLSLEERPLTGLVLWLMPQRQLGAFRMALMLMG